MAYRLRISVKLTPGPEQIPSQTRFSGEVASAPQLSLLNRTRISRSGAGQNGVLTFPYELVLPSNRLNELVLFGLI